jgi:hypothetical protein
MDIEDYTQEKNLQLKMGYEPCHKCHTPIFIKLVRGQKRESILKNPLWFLLATNQRPFTQKSQHIPKQIL